MKSLCRFHAHTLSGMVFAALLIGSMALMGTPASAVGTHGPAFTVTNTVQHPNPTLGERASGFPGPDEAYPAGTVSEGSKGLVALTASLGAMSVIGLASGLWFRVTSPKRYPDE
ncbi:MAG: hypothetical protein KY393_07775 [Actinobacteria bacterium]|nr:hypothetical protein [Actinomycetota bacterium]